MTTDTTVAPAAAVATATKDRWLWAVGAAAALVAAAQVAIAIKLVTIVGFLGAGDAKRPLLGYALLVGALGGLTILGPRRARPLAIGLAASVPVLVLILTAAAGQAWSLLVTALLCLACWRIGRGLLDLLHLRLHPLCGAVLGFGAVGTVVQLAGRVGVLRWWAVALPVLLVGAAAAGELLRAAIPRWRARRAALLAVEPPGVVPALVLVLLLVQLGWALLYAAAPDAQFDAVYAKDWLPEQWALRGRIATLTDHPLLANFGLSQLVAAVGWTVEAAGIGRYLQVAAWVAIVATLLTWPHRKPGWGGLLAAVGVGLMPHVLWQTGTAYDDLVLAAVCLGAAVAVWTLLADRAQATWRSSAVVGLLCGTVLATKLHLIVFAGTLGLVWALAVGGGVVHRMRHVVCTAGTAVLAAGAAPFFRYLDTGNPVFPQLNGFFRSEFFPPVNTTLNFPYAPGGVRELLRLPFDAVVQPALYTEAVPPGAFGFSLVLVAAGLLACWRGGRAGRLVGVALLVTLIVWWLQFRYLRYMLPYAVVAAGAVAAGMGARVAGRGPGLFRERLLAGAVAIVAVATFASSLASFWNIPGRVPADVALGTLSRAEYDRLVVQGQQVLEDLNRLAEPGATVTGDVFARTALRDDLDISPVWELAQQAETRGLPLSTPDELVSSYAALGVRWAAVRTEARVAAAMAPTPDLLATALRTRAEPVSVGGGFELYRLRPDAPTAVPQQGLCDAGFGPAPSVGPQRACWGVTLDGRPGLTPDEAPSGASQVLPACPGTVYAFDIETDAGSSATASFHGGLDRYSTATAPMAGTLRLLAGPTDAPGEMTLVLRPAGAGISRITLSVVSGPIRC